MLIKLQKRKLKITWDKKKLQHICFDIRVQNTEYMICRSKSVKHVEIILKELWYEGVSPYRATNLTYIKKCSKNLNSSFSFAQSAAMQISWNIRNLHMKKEFNPHRSGLFLYTNMAAVTSCKIFLYTPNSNCINKETVWCLETIKQCLIKHTENC